MDILGKFVIYFISALDKKDSKHPLSSRIHRFSVNGIINYFKAEQNLFWLELVGCFRMHMYLVTMVWLRHSNFLTGYQDKVFSPPHMTMFDALVFLVY